MKKWDVQLSKNFTLGEFGMSDTAEQLGINNKMGWKEAMALENLVTKLIQPLREKYGKPIRISSGFRNTQLNAAVGGVPSSQHRKGEAADCAVGTKDAETFWELVQTSGLDYDQVILYRKQGFVHVSLKLEGVNRRENLINN